MKKGTLSSYSIGELKILSKKLEKAHSNILKVLVIYHLIILALLVLFLTCNTVYSAQATLSWNANLEKDLAGYKIYYGNASRTYSTDVNVGNVTTYTIYNLIEGKAYFFAATAYDFTGNESGYSNEVSYDVPIPEPVPDTEPPIPPAGLIMPELNTLKWEESRGEWFAHYNVYKDNAFGLQILGDPSVERFKIPNGWNKEKAEFFVTTVNYGFPFIESMSSNSIRLVFKGKKWRYR